MDRWSDRDDADMGGRRGRDQRPMGHVAKGGLSAFVKADTGVGSAESSAHQPATVTLSRREQAMKAAAAENAARVSAAIAAQPVSPPVATGNAAVGAPSAGPPGFKAPDWACDPPAGAKLTVTKNGALIEEVELRRRATLFGRLANADVRLDHASASRNHAILCFRVDGTAVLMDLDSAHGTFVGTDRLPKHTPLELHDGAELHFGASTRRYHLHVLSTSASSASGSTTRKRSVQWPDAADAEEDSSSKRSRHSLEQVIGYTDSKPFAVNVGPVAVASSESQGKFAHVVAPVLKPSPAQPQNPPSDKPRQLNAGADDAGDQAAKIKRLAHEKFKQFMQGGQGRSSSLYDALPPPTSNAG